MKILFTFLLSIVFIFPVSFFSQNDKNACLPCEELEKLQLPDVWNLKSESVRESTDYCRLTGTISKEINFELLLPQNWNQRFVMGGGGGFVGSVQNAARHKVHEGYATVGTDTGHQGAGIKADWAYNNMERQINYGFLAVHRTAEVAKSIIGEYYCQLPQYSYFIGCSRGGGQAMHEAQKYPDDFDGIVSAAPVISFTATGAEFIQNCKALYPDPDHVSEAAITGSQVAILQEEVLKQCDLLDGVEDQILNDPRDCKFDFSKLPACEDGQESDRCFTAKQIDIVKQIYAGPEIGGTPLYPGFPLGCENEKGSWMTWIVGPDPGTMQLNFPNLHYAFGTELCKYLIFNDPDWDYSTYDFSRYQKDTRFAAAYLDASSTDYSRFKEVGGKLIFYHGWNDPALSALTTIEHFEAVRSRDPQVDEYMRLYLLPGVLHCGGGPGPDQADWLEIVRDWVEKDQPPGRIVVSKIRDKEIQMTRPVYPYPASAQYTGSGDPASAENYREKKP